MVVPEGVVDVLEAVEVQQQQGRRLEPAVGGADRLLDAVAEQLPVGQPGQAAGRLRLLTGGELGGLGLEVEVGRVDPLHVDLVGGLGVAAVDDVEHLPHVPEAGGVPGLDAPGRFGVVGLAAVRQETERDVQRPARVGEGGQQPGARLGQVGVGDGVLLADLVAHLDPGVALAAEVLDLPDRPVGADRGPHGGGRQAEQHRGQAGGRGGDQPAHAAVHPTGLPTRAVTVHHDPLSMSNERRPRLEPGRVVKLPSIGFIGPAATELTGSACPSQPPCPPSRPLKNQ